MNLFKRFLVRRYKEAHEAGREHIYERPYIVIVLGLLLGVAIVGGVLIAKPKHVLLRPTEAHVVFLSDNGTRQTLDTKAKTVGELVKKLPLNLIPEDVVEPSADTPIVQDNFRINIYRARPVTIVASTGSKTVTVTAQRSARVIAQDAGLSVYPEDYVNFVAGDIKQNVIGEQVDINPATPVNLTLYGTPLSVRTHTQTVAELLKEKNIKLDAKDTLTPAPTTPITAGANISIVRNGVSTVTVEQPIAAPTQYVNDASLSFGATALRQAGVAGKQAVTYQIDVEGGVERSRTVLQTTVVQAPVPQIMAIGTIIDIAGNKTAAMAAAGISSGDYGYADYIISHESNWNPSAQNPSGAYGLCQALPGYKMSSAGADWANNPITQLRWCSGYANGHYGSWYGAYSFWLSHRYW